MTVVIFTDEPHSWHTRELRRALHARGMHCASVDLRQCHFSFSASEKGIAETGIQIPGLGKELPQAAFVRGVPGGTLEQVVLRLDILHALRECNVPVYNDARAIERSVDKAMTSFLLHRAKIAQPATWVTEDAAYASRVLMSAFANNRHGRGLPTFKVKEMQQQIAAVGVQPNRMVLKPLFGSQGRGLRRLTRMGLRPPMQAGVAYLQCWQPPLKKGNYCDWRVLVVGGHALAVMRRESRYWVTNIAQGAKAIVEDMDNPEIQELAQVACSAALALGMDYAGVDLLRSKISTAENTVLVLEVNGVPAWRALQRVAQMDIARALIDDLIDRKMSQAQYTGSLSVVGRNVAHRNTVFGADEAALMGSRAKFPF